MAVSTWEFWIDAGGTFTDCLAKAPDGSLRRHKLLSSGATKGRIGADSSHDAIVDLARRSDPVNYWTGCQLSIVDEDGRELDRATVAAFDAASGQLRLRELSSTPVGESRFDELRSQLLSGRCPTRDVESNLADVAGRVAANRHGANRLLRADGSEIQLGGIAQLDLRAGDILIVETPGGGGFGKSE